MKKTLYFLLFFISFLSNAQLDREHWFAPMFDRVNNSARYQSIYVSTNETVPFKIDIYNNNVVVGTVMVSKGNPVQYQILGAQRENIITNNTSRLFTPTTMGYYLKGEKPFFASLRFSIMNHGEILTSKGTAGLGTEFRAVMAPITVSNGILNFMTSVLATEDNTTVTVSDFSPGVVFTNGVPATPRTFTLNKGQSYIIEGRGNFSQNFTGFIGAKIVSSKPISITNGNFNGQYAGNYPSSSDILMDQGVPTDKLGQEFVLMKGNGDISGNMEKGLIVATEDNTDIYINGGGSPVATLNTGQFYQTSSLAYVNQGFGHYNMFIRATKNVYLYQLLAGANSSQGTEEATGGFNYIPPLNCYLPKKIDEIGKINENEFSSNGVSYTLTVPTKLNIITENGATVDVKRNGVSLILNASNGPFPVTGNSNWVTYSIPNISGNIAIFSTKAVTAGISAGNDAVGYGGYFAGFSSIPLITKTEGDCLPGVKLEVTEGFDSYEWLMKVGATYVPAPGVNNTFEYIPTQAGIYAVKVKQGSCPEIQTRDFKFYNCTTYTNTNYDICTTTTITPVFALSSQTLNPGTVVIDTPPTKGTVTKASDGTLTYTANPNATGTDTFKYSFCGNGSIPDCETVQATIHLHQIERYDAVLNECSATSTATYNLTLAPITPDSSVTKKYFTDAAYTNQIPVGQLTNYVSAPGFVYVQMSNSFGCTATATIELKITAPPVVTPSLYTGKTCDEDIDGVIDGIYKIDLTTITPTIVQNPAAFTVKYYATLAQANAGLNNNITGTFTFTADTSVWIRVESPSVCAPVIKEVFLKIGTKATLLTMVATKVICDLLENNSEAINLADYIPLFSTASGVTATYFNSMVNAENNQNAIAANQTITGNRTFYYRISVPGFCLNIGTLNLELKKGTPTALLDSYTVCEGSTITLTAESTYTAYLWKKGATTVSTGQSATLDAGTFTIFFTDANGCVFSKNITVVESPKPQWNITAYNGTHCDDDFDGIIKVNLNNVTPIILPNHALFTVEYFRNSNFTGQILDLANFTYSGNITIYVRATSPYCPTESKAIEFKTGASLPLINATVNYTLCDNDINGTENINLSTLRNLFTTDAAASAKYFATLANAQNNTAPIGTVQTITGDKTFYYRFSKAGFCDVIGTLHIIFKQSTPSTTLPATVTICEGSTTVLNAGPGYTQVLWSTGETTTTITVGVGNYFVDLTNSSGCVYRQTVSVLGSPKPNWNISAYDGTHCDDDFDGIIKVNLNNVTPVILPNHTLFTVEYFRNSNFTGQILDLANFTYSGNTTIYVRATSPYCPTESKPIEFKTGASLPLISATVNYTLCDNDINGTENINLSTLRNLFTTDSAASAKYFATLANAQNNTAPIGPIQTITGDKTFYYRFSKAGFCDVIGTLNIAFKASTPTALLDSYTVCEGSTITLNAESSYVAYLWKKGSATVSTTQTAVLDAGVYTISFTNASGCVFTKNITVLESPKPKWNINAYNGTHCDENFDGIIKVNLNTVTPIILPNHAFFTVEYFRNADFTGQILDLANFTYSANTTIYVRATSPHCPMEFRTIDFKLGNNLPLIKTSFTAKVCDDDFDNIKSVNLSNYKSEFTLDSGVSVTYYANLANAQNSVNPLTNPVTVNSTGTYYLRFHKNNFCDVIGTLIINIQIPKKSDVLVDQTICPEATTRLDAGTGFESYLWSTGETTQTIEVPVGDYWVDLTSNGCVYRQNVSVKAVELPQITGIDIKGSTVTISVTGGNPPYQYAIDNGDYQSSNVFTGVLGGEHTVYVISADNCKPVSETFTVVELYNVITPNGDGMNDVLKYSTLLTKEDASFLIYDRYGKLVFTGNTANRFEWNGTFNGKTVSTGTFWYVMKWREPGSAAVTQYTGWILVKARD